MTPSDALPKITSPAELDGFRDQLALDGKLTPDLQRAIAVRRVELMRGKK